MKAKYYYAVVNKKTGEVSELDSEPQIYCGKKESVGALNWWHDNKWSIKKIPVTALISMIAQWNSKPKNNKKSNLKTS